MSAPNRYISAGTQRTWFGFVDNRGFLIGNSATAPSNGASRGMTKLVGIKRANPGPVEPEDVNITGDDTTLGSIAFGPNEVPSYIIESGAFDLAIQAALQSTAVETLGDIRMGVIQPNDPLYPDVCLIHQAKSKSKDSGSDGTNAWSGYIVPLGNVVPLGRAEFAERAAANDRYRVTAQIASKKPWGVTIAEGDLGTTGAPLIPFTSDNPITMHYFKGDGSATMITLDETPVSQAKVIIHRNTQKLVAGTDYTVNTSTKVVTLTAASTIAADYEILYEYSS